MSWVMSRPHRQRFAGRGSENPPRNSALLPFGGGTVSMGTGNECLLNPSGVLPGVGRPMARAPATEPPTSGHFLLGRRVQLASAALEKLAVCKGPAAAKPSAWAPTGPVQRVDGCKRYDVPRG